MHIEIDALKPVLRAYALGYLTATGPRIANSLGVLTRRDVPFAVRRDLILHILKTSTQINRFPAACAIIAAGSTTIPQLLAVFLKYIAASIKHDAVKTAVEALSRRLRLACTFAAAWVAFSLLNRDEQWKKRRALSQSSAHTDQSMLRLPAHHNQPTSSPTQFAGKTIDFTLFTFCRALDVMVITLWTRTRTSKWHLEQRAPRLANFARKAADPWVFSTSAAVIMWAWFYSPERLPKAYNHWISKAAAIDTRLIEALRLARRGEFIYGQDTGHASLLKGLCHDLDLPEEYGDPSKTVPIPCELYHCGVGKSCEGHALTRFWRSFKFAMELYLPLQLLARLRSLNKDAVLAAVKGAAQSSSFLAAFVAMFYYSVCLARTRLGPKVFGNKTVSPQMWDSGLCTLAGCLGCGWSILLEKPSRRQEVAFFVAPRAMATLLPRVYNKQYQRREQIIFATSIAVVLNAINSGDSQHVRGVLGKLLETVLKV